MKQYIYSPQEAGLDAWPSGELRLEGIDITADPDQADIYVCPGNLSLFHENGTVNKQRLYRLPYLAGKENRNIFFDVSDNFTKPLDLPIVFLRCDLRKWMLPHDPSSIQMGWPVGDFSDCIDLPEGGFRYDVTFRGWLSTQTRIDSARTCKDSESLKSDIVTYEYFTGYIGTPGRPEYDHLKFSQVMDEFKTGMRESRVALCPESIPGVLPYRFFEAMSAGRVPVLVSSDYILPFRDLIPYESFCLFIERDQASNAASRIKEFLAAHSDSSLIAMGLAAREFWLRWLDSRLWPKTMTWAVRRQLEQRGVCG